MAHHYDFRRIKTRSHLVQALGVHPAIFDATLVFEPPTVDVNKPIEGSHGVAEIDDVEIPIFLRHDIPKKNKARGCRTVWEPIFCKSDYKALARRLGSFFRMIYPEFPHACAYGFRAGRNIRENAAVHCGRKLLLSADIESFFGSISVMRVCDLFQRCGIVTEAAEPLSRFVTIQGALPLGLPTSPVISNALALPIDEALQSLAAKYGTQYSRYADDLSFSGDTAVPDIEEVRAVLGAHGFLLANDKTRRSKLGQAHYVTGLSVSDPDLPHVPRRMKRNLRQELYFVRKFGLADHFHRRGLKNEETVQEAFNRLDGLVKYVSFHEPRSAVQLKRAWNELAKANDMRRTFAPKNQGRSPFYIFVDESEFVRDGQTLLALALCVTQHGPEIALESREILGEALGDPLAAGDIATLEKRGLHFADASEDLRFAYVKRLSAMRFEGYVAFGALGSDYESTYLRLLRALITRRLMAAESQAALFYVEQNDRVSQRAIKSVIEEAYIELRQRKDRHPRALGIDFVGKPDARISAPDFLLGVLKKYLQSKPAEPEKPEPRDRLQFERLRDKYRLIFDLDAQVEYSRRRPIEPWH